MSQHPAVPFRPARAGAAAVLALALGTLSPAAANVAPRDRPGDAVQTALNDLVGGGEFPGALAAVRMRDGRSRDLPVKVHFRATSAMPAQGHRTNPSPIAFRALAGGPGSDATVQSRISTYPSVP